MVNPDPQPLWQPTEDQIRVANMTAQKEDPQNFLLLHAMCPNVAGVIGSAVAAGVLLSMLGPQ